MAFRGGSCKMADRRPYMTFGIEKLEALAEASKNDLILRKDLIAELATRNTSRAKALKKKLGEVPSGGVKAKTSVPVSKARKSAVAVEPVLAPRLTDQAIIEDLELLRQTFTESSEILSRWGMTESMPDDLKELVFENWTKRLAKVSLTGGRTLARLKTDRIKLQAIIDSKVKPVYNKQRGTKNG